jgi:hypothetical protein
MNAFYSILNTFFKNFDKKNWSSALLKGKLHFRNLEFNEVVIHQLLELPPHLLVRRMTCDDLRIKATWTKLGSKPIEVQIGTIVLDLVEAPSLRKPPRIAQIEPPPPGQYKRSFATNLVENMNIAIHCIRISFQPLGDSPATSLPRPMHLALHSLSVQVADSHFHTRINLPDLINANKNQPEVTLYRVVEIETVSLAFGADVILDRSNVNVHVTATLSAADGHLLGGTIAVVIDRLAFAITPLAADALLQTVETMYWLKKKPYDDTTVRCVTLPQHPPPRDVAVVINPADAGVVLADDPEYAKNYGQLIPNRKSRFEPLFEKIWRVDVNIGIVNFEWIDAPLSSTAPAAPPQQLPPVSSGCVVSINHLHVDVYFHDRPLPPDANEAAARKRVEYLKSKQRVIDERAEARQSDGNESDSSTSSTTPLVPVAPAAVSASTRARAESLEQAALARRAAHERRLAAANEAAADDATGRLQQDVDSLLADVAEIEREREIAAIAGKPVPAVPTVQTPPTKKKNVAKKAVKWTAKITTQATKATARATGRAFRAVNPIGRSASKRSVSTEPQVAPHSALHKSESTPVGLRAASTTAAVSVPKPPPKVLPPHAIASLPTAQMSQSSPALLSPPAAQSLQQSPGRTGAAAAAAKPSATPPPRSKTPVEDDDDDESESLKQLVKARTAPAQRGQAKGGDDDDWLMVDAAAADTPEPARSVQVASGKEYRDDKNEKWRSELTDATVRVNVTVALLTIRDSTSPADASTYLLQPLMDDRSRRADPAVNVRIDVELCHDEHLAIDVGVTVAPMVVRAEADRWSAVSAAVLPRAVRPPPWLPPTDPDEFNSLNVLVRLRALRLTLPPAVRNEATQGLVVCTLRDVALQLIDHDKLQFDAAAFPPTTTVALPAPGLGLTRLGVRVGVQSVNVITRQSANDDADNTAEDSPLFDAAPIALAVTLESWRALLRWSGECELIERELARRIAEGDDSDASALLALVPELDEALRDICRAHVQLTSQHWHAVVDWAGYDRAATVLASYLSKPSAASTAAVATVAAPAVAELSLIRAIPIQIDLNAALDNVSFRLRLRDSEHLPWVLNKPPAVAVPAAAAAAAPAVCTGGACRRRTINTVAFAGRFAARRVNLWRNGGDGRGDQLGSAHRTTDSGRRQRGDGA